MLEAFRGILSNLNKTELPVLNATCEQMEEYFLRQRGKMGEVIQKMTKKFSPQGVKDWMAWRIRQ